MTTQICYYDCMPGGYSDDSTHGYCDEDPTKLQVVVISKGGSLAVETSLAYLDEAYMMTTRAEIDETAAQD